MEVRTDIEKVQISFSNNGAVVLNVEDFVYIDLKDIVSNLTVKNGKLLEIDISEKAIFAIKNSKKTQRIINRIQAINDIVNINLIFEKAPTKEIYVSWKGSVDYNNENQSSSLDSNGNLYVCIGKGLIPKYVFETLEIR